MSSVLNDAVYAVDPARDAEGSRRRAIDLMRKYAAEGCDSYEPILPLLFRLNGKPYTLRNHFPFKDTFLRRRPVELLLKTARQVGKTQGMAADGSLLSQACPYSVQLFVTPLYEQIRRFSANYMDPLIDECCLRKHILDSTCDQSVLQKSFVNKSVQIYSYAYLSSSRIRGIGGVWMLRVDEVQDMAAEHGPIMAETMSAAPAPWGLTTRTGTPKGLDNPIEGFWQDSSQAEWFVKCPHGGCGHVNICSIEYDLREMIGPVHDGIGPNCPGTICRKCAKPVDPSTGQWVHRYPDRQWKHRGLHVPQPIMPMHYANVGKWAKLVAKMQGKNNTSPDVFDNEVLGESCDSGSKLVTLNDLKAACDLPWENVPKEPPSAARHWSSYGYLRTVLAADWGGGGGTSISGKPDGQKGVISFTVLSFLGIRHDGRIDVLWGAKLLTPNDHAREAADVIHFAKILQPTVFAHDFTGAGAIRETLLVQSGFPLGNIAGFDYKHMPTDNIIKKVDDDPFVRRPYYRVDKTRVILTVATAIKFGLLHFFKFDAKDSDDRGLVSDFLALTQEKIETVTADRYVIRRHPALSDDFAQSVTMGACALWRMMDLWPDFAKYAARSPDWGAGDPMRRGG